MKKFLSCSLLLVFSFFLTEMASAQVPGAHQIPGSGSNLNIPVVTIPMPATVSKGGSHATTIQVSPNPNAGQFSVRYYAAQAGKVAVSVTSSNGNGMIVIEALATPGNNIVPIDITSYGPGMYKVTVSGAGVYGSVSVTVR